MRGVILALAGLAVALALAACGGGGQEPSAVRLTLEADLSRLPEGSEPEAAIQEVMDVLSRRAAALGISEVEISPEGENRLSVAVSRLSAVEARQLLGTTARLELRQPLLEEGEIVCQDESGARFSVPPEGIVYVRTISGPARAPRCQTPDGRRGEILWEPATASDSQGQTRTLDSELVQSASLAPSTAGGMLVVVNFGPEGTDLLEKVSTRLVGLPVGIFLDDRLLAGPTIREPITSGGMAIAGLDVRQASILAAQLSVGPLPLPITTVGIE